DGMVTFNIIGGNGNTEQCSAIKDGVVVNPMLSGIVGPGDIGDPFQPKFALQNSTVADGKCIAHLVFDKKGNVQDVTVDNAPGYTATECLVGSPGVGSKDKNNVPFPSQFAGPNIIIGGEPLQNNNGPHGITFGTGTTTCYGPSIPSPAKCVCTKSPCP